VERAEVPKEIEFRPDVGGVERGHVALNEADFRIGSFCQCLRSFNRAGNKIDSRDLPAACGKFECPMAGAAANIERSAVGRRSLGLLAVE
jgi:hypothetical protein